jgi:hypothetical protein
MAKTGFSSGPWRIDPQKRSQVIDRFGRNVASVEPEVDASLVATAPEMFALLERLEEEDDNSIPQTRREEIQFVLRKARGDFDLAAFPGGLSRQNLENRDWLKFVAGLLRPGLETE